MRALAIDTTTAGGSLALCESGGLVAVETGDATLTHGERLMTDIHRLLDAHGWNVADIDVYGVAAGPGSFTGLRIGIATVQGLAMVHERPVAAVSALDALAESVASLALGERHEVQSLMAWMDAHRHEIFWAHYSIVPAAQESLRPLPVAGPSVEDPLLVLERWAQDPSFGRTLFVGDGAVRYAEAIRTALGPRGDVLSEIPPIAPSIARMALAAVREGRAVSPRAVRPLYVRRPDAELAREARADKR
jgi:tRNA threonylcarbamoyladenosine biosynthesis protein TsaB